MKKIRGKNTDENFSSASLWFSDPFFDDCRFLLAMLKLHYLDH